jgi:hypothetical protein
VANFLYPRVISLSRPNADAVVGAQPYSGVLETNETVILTGVPAHIQVDRQGTSPVAKLPADAAGQSIWKIIFKLPLGTVQSGDILTDDLGERYQVIASDWGPLVTTCRCQILQT